MSDGFVENFKIPKTWRCICGSMASGAVIERDGKRLHPDCALEDVEAKLADCERRERAAVERAEALRAALEEISVPPDARSSKGEDYGCLDLHEARTIAFDALDADDEARAT